MDYAGFDCKITVPLQSPSRHRRWLIVGNSMQAKAKPEVQLGDRQSQGIEPRRGSVVAIPTNPSSIHSIIDYRGYSNYPPQKQAPAIFAKAAFFIFK